ncbi:hypothetical protein DFAR_560017 [Desulfarculales bacterium]
MFDGSPLPPKDGNSYLPSGCHRTFRCSLRQEDHGVGAAFLLAPAGEVSPVWERPALGARLRASYFDEVPTVTWLRHFRCPVCRAVIRLRPRDYWSRFQAPAAGEPIPGFKLVGRSAWGPILAQWPRPNRGQPVGAKREPFSSLSYLPKGAIALARPPGLHLGETPPWRFDMDEDQAVANSLLPPHQAVALHHPGTGH